MRITDRNDSIVSVNPFNDFSQRLNQSDLLLELLRKYSFSCEAESVADLDLELQSTGKGNESSEYLCDLAIDYSALPLASGFSYRIALLLKGIIVKEYPTFSPVSSLSSSSSMRISNPLKAKTSRTRCVISVGPLKVNLHAES
jgi:hypothetical protein